MLQRVLIITVFLIACSCSESETEGTANRETAQLAIRQAETMQMAAGQPGLEWTSIEPLLDAARKAAVQGDFKKAITLAKEAERHAEAAVKQAGYERQHWQERVPHRENK